MLNLYYQGEPVGVIEVDDEDPPFYSGYFLVAKELSPVAQRAFEYLTFCMSEFELKDDSPAHLKFEKEKEALFPEFIFSEEWKLGEELSSSTLIEDPLLSKAGMIFWTVNEIN
jgi:hypothetical protein